MFTATIIAVETDEKGNIKVTTDYKDEGVLIQTGVTRYSSLVADEAYIRSLISFDINRHLEAIIGRTYAKTTDVVLSDNLKDLLNSEVQKDQTVIKITTPTGQKELTVDGKIIISEVDVIGAIADGD